MIATYSFVVTPVDSSIKWKVNKEACGTEECEPVTQRCATQNQNHSQWYQV